MFVIYDLIGVVINSLEYNYYLINVWNYIGMCNYVIKEFYILKLGVIFDLIEGGIFYGLLGILGDFILLLCFICVLYYFDNF